MRFSNEITILPIDPVFSNWAHFIKKAPMISLNFSVSFFSVSQVISLFQMCFCWLFLFEFRFFKKLENLVLFLS